MLKGTGVEDLLSSIVSIMWFVASVTVLISITGKGYDIAGATKNLVTSNETIVETAEDNAEYGYYDSDGEEYKYDGSLSGHEVFSNIMNSDSLTIYVKHGNKVVNLSNQTVYRRNLLDYVQNVDRNQLKNYIDVNANYVRKYSINAHGNVVAVTFEKVE